MGVPRFTRPKGGNTELSPYLYVANCGPAVGLSFELIASVFGRYGEVKGVYAADESGTRVIVCFDGENSAESAMKALDGRPCPHLGGRSLHIRYSVHSSRPVPKFLRIFVFLCSFVSPDLLFGALEKFKFVKKKEYEQVFLFMQKKI